jgi:hypothetical protein
MEDCLAGSPEPGCELPLTISEGPLGTTTPFFDCSGWDGEWVSPVCSARDVPGTGSNPVVFRPDDFHAGHYFVLAMDPATDTARFCTEYQTDVYAYDCPVGGEDWKCAIAGTLTIEEDPPAGFEPRTELRATFPDGGMVHAVW